MGAARVAGKLDSPELVSAADKATLVKACVEFTSALILGQMENLPKPVYTECMLVLVYCAYFI